MVSPGSANMVQVQSALFSYSEGKCGLEIVPLVPRSVPPQAPSADEQNINYKWSCTSNKWSIILVSAIANPALLYPLRTHKYMHTQEQNIIQVNGMEYFLAFKQQRFLVWVFWLFFPCWCHFSTRPNKNEGWKGYLLWAGLENLALLKCTQKKPKKELRTKPQKHS